MLVAHLPDLPKVFEFAFLFAVFASDERLGGQPGEEVVRFDLFALCQQAGIGTKHFDECVNLSFGGFS